MIKADTGEKSDFGVIKFAQIDTFTHHDEISELLVEFPRVLGHEPDAP